MYNYYIMYSVMKRCFLYLLILVGGVAVSSCQNDDTTYSEQKEEERELVSNFVKRDVVIRLDDKVLAEFGPISVLTEEEFVSQDSCTDVSKNEYVLFKNTGVYMQILRKGTGRKMTSGGKMKLVCRFWEYNIRGDSIQQTNRFANQLPEVFTVSGSFGNLISQIDLTIPSSSVLYSAYSDTSVPTGWLAAIPYLRLGRQTGEEQIAKVRLIVPHSSGQSHAKQNVYPCMYEMTLCETD